MNDQEIQSRLDGVRNIRLCEGGELVDVTLRSGLIEHGTPAGERILDGEGAILHPGFVDAHMHFGLGGDAMSQLDLSEISSRQAFEEAIDERHASLPKGRWLRASGWNDALFERDGMPDATWLTGTGDRPVVAYRVDQHACVVNEPVLELLKDQTCPPGGRVVTGKDGRPNGLMVESAAWHLVNPIVPDPSLEERRQSIRDADAHCAAMGLVTVGSMEYAKELAEAIEPIRDELRVRLRITLLDREWPLDFSFACDFDSDDMLTVIGCKAFIDGTLGSRSAAMLEPYSDDPDAGDGMLVELAEQGVLEDWIQAVHAHGFSPSMHAIGDRALRLALDAADTLPEEARSWVRFEHAQTAHPEDVARFAGRFASMQPRHKAMDAPIVESRLGTGRMGHFYPFASLQRAGARLAFGSDWPIVDCNPFSGIRAAVTGRDIEGGLSTTNESIDIETALRAYTVEARACLGLSGGTLNEGDPADLVLLDRDPRTVDWMQPQDPEVLATIVDGRLVHRRLS